MYERFTERCRKLMQLSNEEAQRFNHECIGTEHVLLGLLKEGSGVGANVLKNLVDPRKVRLEVERLMLEAEKLTPSRFATVTKGKLSQTRGAKKVVEFAIGEARNLNHKYVGTEHMLLGLLREQDGVAAIVLTKLGITLEKAREEVVRLLASNVHDDQLSPAEEAKLSPAEQDLVRIHREMRTAEKEYIARENEVIDHAERARFIAEAPAVKYVPQFVDFERHHHGTHAGLMAARQVLLKATAWYEPGDVREHGRREILSVLGDYAAAPELPEMLRYLADGRADPACEAFLRQLASDEKAGERNRACAGYLFARWCEAMDFRQWIEKRLEELDAGTAPLMPGERGLHEQRLAALPPAEKLTALKSEAAEMLESLSNCPADLREPMVAVEFDGAIVAFSPEQTERMPTIRDLAAGLLFKMRYLNVGNKTPDLQLDLIDGRRWSLAEQAGKVVVIQFANKGCGPCEQEYPVLRWLTEEYGDKVEVLSIMGDPKREDTTKAVESGKLSWNVYWDGQPGPITTKWAVTRFPAEYVVGPDGRIAGNNLRGGWLKTRVARLVR